MSIQEVIKLITEHIALRMSNPKVCLKNKEKTNIPQHYNWFGIIIFSLKLIKLERAQAKKYCP